MNTGDMIKLLTSYVDDIPITDDAIRWLNMGKNKMAIAVKAKFPDLPDSSVDTGLTSTFVFDSKYHEVPVLYAAAMFKAQDASLREKDSFIIQFNTELENFVKNYSPDTQYRDDELCQQFTATDGQTVFTITKPTFSADYGNLQVFQNGLLVDSTTYTLDHVANTVTLTTACALNDAITALWEEHSDFVQPPLPWWGSW